MSTEETRLHLVPVRQKDAKAFVAEWHRHHKPPLGAVFTVGAADQHGVLRAVAIVGRPVARHFDDGQTLEVTRTATDGVRNANSLAVRSSLASRESAGVHAADHVHAER
ncbi:MULTISPECIES: XF1762 family protein [Streptomyces]|uniref:XF1762 family protein n=1 Tax=Streptomyces galilaeus TaxID=33899 RepID=A0ABW9IM07_STRGJ